MTGAKHLLWFSYVLGAKKHLLFTALHRFSRVSESFHKLILFGFDCCMLCIVL